MADTPSGETATPGSVSNDVSTTTAPAGDNGSSAEVERLRKEAEQARMRANQLANELEAKNKAEEAAKQKQMEEKEEFKALYEQTQKRLDEMEASREAERKSQELQQATQDVLKDYPENVRKLAETAGLQLTDSTDDAKTSLKGKLDAFKSQVAPATTNVTPNNPYNPTPNTPSRQELVERKAPGQESVMALEAAKGNLGPTYEYIGSLPAIQRMREISKGA